jgi:membrane protease YdiL (CAAX protease family)
MALSRLRDRALTALTGRRWLAAGVSLAAFGVAHLPVWGAFFAFTTVVSGSLMTAFYPWRRDVLALIVAHVASDLAGLASW